MNGTDISFELFTALTQQRTIWAPDKAMTVAARGGMPKQRRKSSQRSRQPQTNGRLDGKRTLSTENLATVDGEQVVVCTVRDGDEREVRVPIKSSELQW